MQQRMGIAQALLNDPLVVFLDEPTSALDPVGRMDVRTIIRQLRDEGRTVLLNSHLLSEVEQVCDRVAIINHGRVATIGPLNELRRREVRVQVQLGAPNSDHTALLERAGRVQEALALPGGNWQYTLELTEMETVPALVAALVGAGAQVQAVTPHQDTLEALFLDIVGVGNGEHVGAGDSRVQHGGEDREAGRAR
jgi:ABC-2 type transport system ATP-binding protein